MQLVFLNNSDIKSEEVGTVRSW